MATGIEIVGLVLGGLPLVINAIERFRDGLNPIQDYRRYGNTLKGLRTRLRIQQDLYEGTLKRLLLPEISEPEANALFPISQASTNVALWGTIDIKNKLRSRLGSRYDTFMDVVAEMQAIMVKLMFKLDIDIESKPGWTDPATSSVQSRKRLEWEWRKVRRSFGRKERDELIGNFERYNLDIAASVEQQEILAALIIEKSESYLKYVNLVRNHACGLYEVVETCWKCQCLEPHHANLQLDPQVVIRKNPSFQVHFSFHHSLGQEIWQEARVDIEELDISPTVKPSSLQAPIISMTHPLNSTSSNLAPLPGTNKTKKSVRICEPPETDFVQASNSSTHQPTCKGSHTSLSLIDCLCQAILDAQKEPKCLGVLADTSRKRNISITTTTIAPTPPPKLVLLESLLQSKQPHISQRINFGKLSRRQRLEIAVTLASSVLQLHQSPWLSEIWSKKDIKFFFQGLDKDNQPLINHAYVSRSFSPSASRSTLQLSPNLRNNDILDSLIINKTLFALGIVLVELCLNKPLEDLRTPQPNDDIVTTGNLIDDYQTAVNKIDAVFEKAGTNYGFVVQRCLRCQFELQDSKKQLDFDVFKRLVYEGVLAPLEKDLKQFSLHPGITI